MGFDPVAKFGAGNEVGGQTYGDDGLRRFARTGNHDAQRRIDDGDEESAVGDVADVGMAILDANREHHLAALALCFVDAVVPGPQAAEVAAAALEWLEAFGDVGAHGFVPWMISGLGMRLSRKAAKISLAAGAATRSEK